MSHKLSEDTVLNSFSQKFANFLHQIKAIFKRKEKEKVEWLGRYIQSGSTILDVGANMGYFTKEFAYLHNSSCKVFGFEPFDYNFDILKKVTNKFKNVTIEKLALSNKNGEEDIYIPVKNKGKIGPGLVHLGKEEDRDFIIKKIQTQKLDDYVKEKNIEKIDFIKCDVEGAEYLVFEGGLNIIRSSKPTVFCEINEEYLQRLECSASDIFNLFKNMGYSIYKVNFLDFHQVEKVDGYSVPSDYLFVLEEVKN